MQNCKFMHHIWDELWFLTLADTLLVKSWFWGEFRSIKHNKLNWYPQRQCKDNVNTPNVRRSHDYASNSLQMPRILVYICCFCTKPKSTHYNSNWKFNWKKSLAFHLRIIFFALFVEKSYLTVVSTGMTLM